MIARLRRLMRRLAWQWRGKEAILAHLTITGWETGYSQGFGGTCFAVIVRRNVHVSVSEGEARMNYGSWNVNKTEAYEIPGELFWKMALYIVENFDR